MEKDQEQQPGKENETKQEAGTSASSVDRKNEAAAGHTPSATDRVKPRSGDGLANEGTNVSYESER